MQLEDIPHQQRQERMNVRNFYLTATLPELKEACRQAVKERQYFKAGCLFELLQERLEETREKWQELGPEGYKKLREELGGKTRET